MEIRTETELDAAIAVARLSKAQQLLRLAWGRTLRRPRRAAIQVAVAGLAGVLIVAGLAGGRLSVGEALPWLLLPYALYLGQRIDALVELYELSQSDQAMTKDGGTSQVR
jgi:hypothetical protein